MILMDVQMPVMDGLRPPAASAMAKIHRDGLSPILAMTANAF